MLDDVYLLRRVLGEIDHGALRLERRGKDGGAFLLRRVLGDIDQGSLRLERHEVAIAIFFAFPDLSGVEKDISQAGR